MSGNSDTPEIAARKIVEAHCSDMPDERKNALIEAIEEAISDWGNLCASVEAEAYKG